MAAQQNQINLGKYCIPLQGMVNWLSRYIISRSINQHLDQQYVLLNVYGGCQETGALWSFALLDIV